MCTVAFVPLADGGYLLGHNRDERRSRPRGEPPRWEGPDRRVLAPRDPEGGGTWIGLDRSGRTVSILNAAEPEGRILPPAPRSRGLVVRDVLLAASAEEGLGDLTEVRAFELLEAVPGSGGAPASILRIRWDGRTLARERASGPLLAVSSTLDPLGADRERRASWRRRFPGDPPGDPEPLSLWLRSHEPERGSLSVCMHREDASTVCRSLVLVAPAWASFEYTDGPPCDAASPRESLGFHRARGL